MVGNVNFQPHEAAEIKLHATGKKVSLSCNRGISSSFPVSSRAQSRGQFTFLFEDDSAFPKTENDMNSETRKSPL